MGWLDPGQLNLCKSFILASSLAQPDRPESGGEFDKFREMNMFPVKLLFFFIFFLKSKGLEQSSVNSIFHSPSTTTTVTHHLILCFEAFWVDFFGCFLGGIFCCCFGFFVFQGWGVRGLFVCFIKLCDKMGSPAEKGQDFSNQDES